MTRLRAGIVLIAFAALMSPGVALAQFSSQNVALRSQVTLTQFGSGSGAGCTGYVSPSGREYAVMGLNNKVSVVEVTNPSAPVIVGSVSHSSGLWSEVAMYGQYVYASNETGGGIDIIDLGNVDNGAVTLVQRMTSNGVNTTHTVTVDPVSGFLYLNGSNVGSGRLMAFSLANPAAPTFAGQATSAVGAYVHDSHVVTYTSGPYAGQQIAFCFSGGTGLDILNVTNKANMVRLSRTEYSNLVYCHQGWLSADRQYLYVDDEIDDLPYTRVFSVSNLSSPVELAPFFIGAPSIDHNQYIRDGFLFQANYTSGLHIHDTQPNPTSPIHLGFFDTHPENDGMSYDGAWNTFPYFPSGTVLISDINRGLFILDPTAALNYLTFTYPNGQPSLVSPAGGTTMRVQVSGRIAGPQPNSGLLHVDTGSGFVSVPMTPVSANEYDAVFPPADCGATVRYYVSAENALGTRYSNPAAAPSSFHSAIAASSTTAVVSDTFEAASGWTGGVAGDTATTGQWVRVNPNGTDAQPEDDHTPAPGVACWVTGQGTVGGMIGAQDVDGGRTTLLSPAFNLSGTNGAIMSYWRWYSNDQGGAANEDTFLVDLSFDNGTSWTSVEIVGPSGPGTSGGWIFHSFNVGDLGVPTAQVRIRFVAQDLGMGSIVEAAIDDFEIRTFECDPPPCPGDLDDSGVVDLNDLALLLADYGCTGGGCTADLDGDGSTDLDDLALLLASFGSPCP
jgi:choice-of-anchor B domain-containing protein